MANVGKQTEERDFQKVSETVSTASHIKRCARFCQVLHRRCLAVNWAHEDDFLP